MLRITPVLACVLLALPLWPVPSVRAVGTVELPIGSVWVYEYSERVTATGPNDYLTIGGTWRIYCIGLADSVEGGDSQTLEFHSSIRANVSGQVVRWSQWGNPSTYSTEGTLKITGDEFYNFTTGFLVRSVYDQELKVGYNNGGSYRSIVYNSAHNETTYTKQELHFSGKSIDSDYSNLVPGDNWTMVYQGRCNTTGVLQRSPFSYGSVVNETLHYTYLGEQSITVPAGVFVCKVLESTGDSYNTTEWYDPAVEANVKVVTSAENDTVTSSLMNYTLNHESLNFDNGPVFNEAFFVLGVVVAVSAVILIPLSYLWATRRSPQK